MAYASLESDGKVKVDEQRVIHAISRPAAGTIINLDAALGNLFKWTAGENETVNIASGQQAGRVITLMIANDALARTITLGTGIVSAGVIVGTALRTAVVVLQSDGQSYFELSRALGL